jgi:transcriptional regulator with PAS, ATPase and Fis domain
LLAYEFPGNVRELANIIERAVIVCGEADEVEDSHLPDSVRLAATQQSRKHRRPTLAEIESDYIRETLAATRGNKTEAAKILGISRKNLYERLARENAEVRGQRSEISKDVSQTNASDD